MMIKQAASNELAYQISLSEPTWYTKEESELIQILKKYSVVSKLAKINNLELTTMKQKDNEGIRAFVSCLENQAGKFNLVVDHPCQCGRRNQAQVAPIFIRQSLMMSLQDKQIKREAMKQPNF